MLHTHSTRSARAGRQQGVVLLIALIVLVAMTLAGLGMIRSLDTGALIANNIGFRQSAVASADGGTEQAVAWLVANPGALDSDNPGMGYYSTRQDGLDVTGNRSSGTTDNLDWTSQARSLGAITGDATGNQVYYIINRLCSIAGSINAPTQTCTTTSGTGSGSTMDSPTYDVQGMLTANRVYYRITTKVIGPRNTVSYVQAVVLL
jgi:Tfp pilus assembly protein PilX